MKDPKYRSELSFRSDSNCFGFKPIPRSSRNNLTRTHMKLARSINKRRTIIIYITNKMITIITLDLRSLSLNSPIIDCFEEWTDLIFFFEFELGGVDGGEGDWIFVSRFEVEIRWIGVGGVEVEVCVAFWTGVDWSHCCCCREMGEREGGVL